MTLQSIVCLFLFFFFFPSLTDPPLSHVRVSSFSHLRHRTLVASPPPLLLPVSRRIVILMRRPRYRLWQSHALRPLNARGMLVRFVSFFFFIH